MMSNDFEKAFGDFMERREYDQAENALFAMVRIAFTAGWLAAGGDPPQPQKKHAGNKTSPASYPSTRHIGNDRGNGATSWQRRKNFGGNRFCFTATARKS